MSVITLPDLVIASGATESSHIGQLFLDHLDELTILAPEGALSGTVTVEVSQVDPDGSGTPVWRTLTQPDGTPVPVAADEATPIPNVSFAGIRLTTTVAPGADETYSVTGQDR